MKKINYQVAIFTVAFAFCSMAMLPACASKKTISGLDRVNQNQKNLEESDKKLAKAQSELSSFQDTLKDLRGGFKDSETNGANEALGRLSMKIEQAQLDLREAKSQNDIAIRDLDNRLKNAASENNRVLETGTSR